MTRTRLRRGVRKYIDRVFYRVEVRSWLCPIWHDRYPNMQDWPEDQKQQAIDAYLITAAGGDINIIKEQ